MTSRNYTSSHDVGSVRKENYIDELFLETEKKKKHQHIEKYKKNKQAKHLMMTRDYRSELVNTIKKHNKTNIP